MTFAGQIAVNEGISVFVIAFIIYGFYRHTVFIKKLDSQVKFSKRVFVIVFRFNYIPGCRDSFYLSLQTPKLSFRHFLLSEN